MISSFGATTARGVMPIQSEGARFLSQMDFNEASKIFFFSIFNTITLAWLDRSVRQIISC